MSVAADLRRAWVRERMARRPDADILRAAALEIETLAGELGDLRYAVRAHENSCFSALVAKLPRDMTVTINDRQLAQHARS
mgnify:CR=1 FL=1